MYALIWMHILGVHAQAVGVTLHTAARRGMLQVLEFLILEDGVAVDVLGVCVCVL